MKDSRSHRKGNPGRFSGIYTNKGEPTCECGFTVRKITRLGKAIKVMEEHFKTCATHIAQKDFEENCTWDGLL